MNEKTNGKLIGYARVSTTAQDLALQISSLEQAGCAAKNIHTDKISGSKASRPGLDQCLQSLHAGDTLLVWRLDRLGRSMGHLVQLIEQLKARGVGFKSLCDGAIDTTTASGELIFHIFSSLAQFERRLIQERTMAGLSVARARGKRGGRPPIPATDPRVLAAKQMHENKSMSIADICKSLRVSRPTLYRYLSLDPHTRSEPNDVAVCG